MTNWRKKIKIKQFFSDKEDYKSVQEDMTNIADVLEKHYEFKEVISKLRNIPKGDDVITSTDYANKILDMMYDIADEEKIWIE